MNVTWEELEPRMLSPKLWSRFAPPIGGAFPYTGSGNPSRGLFDDFNAFGICSPLATSTTYFESNGITYLGYNDTTVVPTAAAVPTTTPAVDENGPGVIILQPFTDPDDSAVIMAGSGTMVPFAAIVGTSKDLVFETRFKVSAITASCTDLFIGLAGTGACADTGVQADNSSTLASNNFLGFTRAGSATSGLTFTVQRVSGTQQEHADIGTIVADTYIKAGFRYNADKQNCTVWIDGEQVHEVTKAQCAATPWPTLFMTFLAEMKRQATASHQLYIDWWACAQALG